MRSMQKDCEIYQGNFDCQRKTRHFLVCDMRNLSNTSIKNIRYVGVNAVTIYVKYMRVSNVDKILQKVEILNVGDIASVEN